VGKWFSMYFELYYKKEREFNTLKLNYKTIKMSNKFKIYLIAFLSAFSISANAQEINTSYIDSVFNSNYKLHKFSGMVLVAQMGKIVFNKSYGLANYELNQSFNDDSRFQIASLSKQFTAYAILYLQQQGKLSIDDYVAKYLPRFPFKNITIRHLLTHTSGLPNSEKSMWKDYDTKSINGNVQMLDMLETNKYPLQWEPGQKWEYSDIGYCTLGTLIEVVSGERYDMFMKKHLFYPAKMENTTAELYTDIRKIDPSNLSIGYEYDAIKNKYLPADLLPKNSFVQYLGGFYGDGSVVSTADDLLKWDQELYNNKIITKESVEQSMTPSRLNDGKLIEEWGGNYGIGWGLFSHPELGKMMVHGGYQPGFLSKFMRFTDQKITVIILSNTSDDAFWTYTNIADGLLINDNKKK